MNEEKKRILDMLSEGKLTTEEAMLLLEQLGGPEMPAASAAPRRSEGRMLRIVCVVRERGNAKPTNVTVNLPLKAARALGGAMHAMVPPKARQALVDEGIDLDGLDLIAVIDALAETGGDIVNVTHEDEEDQVMVRVFVE